MANKRVVKKDIENATYVVVHDCLSYIEVSEEDKKQDEVVKIISNILQVRNDLIVRVNGQKKASKKEVKDYYKDIYATLEEQVGASFDALSKLVKK